MPIIPDLGFSRIAHIRAQKNEPISVHPFGWQSILLYPFRASPDSPGHNNFPPGSGPRVDRRSVRRSCCSRRGDEQLTMQVEVLDENHEKLDDWKAT